MCGVMARDRQREQQDSRWWCRSSCWVWVLIPVAGIEEGLPADVTSWRKLAEQIAAVMGDGFGGGWPAWGLDTRARRTSSSQRNSALSPVPLLKFAGVEDGRTMLWPDRVGRAGRTGLEEGGMTDLVWPVSAMAAEPRTL